MIPWNRFLWPIIALSVVCLVGTIGYAIMAPPEASFFDPAYMTFITITTIGYTEVIDLTGNDIGRIFTVFIALSGFGIFTYIISSITAFIVEGRLTETFWRRKMEKKAALLVDHFIVCGVKGTGGHIARELQSTGRPFVVVDIDRLAVAAVMGDIDEVVIIEGDATDNEVLQSAGIMNAHGVFASTGDDNQDLVISLTAKQLNPQLRVVSSCKILKNMDKMQTAGADAVVPLTFIGGLRMASEMVRPTVVSFLDTMLRDKEKGLRVEELTVPDSAIGRPINSLNLQGFPRILILAVKKEDEWHYNPPRSYELRKGDTLIFMAPPSERVQLEEFLHRI